MVLVKDKDPHKPTLHDDQGRMLGVLTIQAVQRLGGDSMLFGENNDVRNLRMARVGDIVLVDHPADDTEPRSINCYLIEVENGKAFKIEPKCLLYSLQWLHNATPSDCNLALVRDPCEWFDKVGLTLLAALSKGGPQLRDRLSAAT